MASRTRTLIKATRTTKVKVIERKKARARAYEPGLAHHSDASEDYHRMEVPRDIHAGREQVGMESEAAGEPAGWLSRSQTDSVTLPLPVSWQTSQQTETSDPVRFDAQPARRPSCAIAPLASCGSPRPRPPDTRMQPALLVGQRGGG